MKDTNGRPDESLPVRRSIAPPLSPPAPEYADDYGPEAPPAAAHPGKRVSFRLLTRALRRHWWQALLLWTVGSAGLVYLAHSRIKPTFDAASEVKVEVDNTTIWGSGAQQVDFGQFMRSQAVMIANPQIIGAALAEHPDLVNTPMLKGTDDREAEIRQSLRVFVVPQTQFIQVQMSSPVFGEAAKIVNAVVEAYLKHAQAIYDTSTQKKIDALKPTRDAQQEEVLKQRTLVQSLSAQVEEGIVEAATNKSRASLEAYNRMSEQLTNVEIMVITAKAKLDQLKAAKELPRVEGKVQVDFQVGELFLNHPAVQALQGKIDQASQKLREVERLVKHQNDPSHVRAAERIKELNAQREDLWRQLEPTLRNQVTAGPVDNSIEVAIKEAELELNSKTVQKEALESRLSQLKIENNTAQAGQNKLEYAKKDLSRKELVLDKIEDTLNQLQFNARNPAARVELNFPATPTIRPNSDRRHQVMAAAPAFVGLLVMGMLVMLELRGGRVGDPDELATRMNLQVIGVVPPLPQIRVGLMGHGGNGHANGSNLPVSSSELRAQRQLDEFVQSLDHLRVALCARRDRWGRDRHCVLITSACGSEGKTTLAAQLAERCVNAGLMTLLIDADLRNPTLSRMLDAADSPGLINVLRGEMSAEDVVTVVHDAGGFHLLPAGTPRVDPSKLLQGERLGNLIAQARESFEMIIVDAPPVLPVPDALTIGRWTDGAVLAVRYDTSRFPLVERANRRLAHVGVPVIGAVVNGVRSVESTYGGYYGYGYGSSNYSSVPTTTTVEE